MIPTSHGQPVESKLGVSLGEKVSRRGEGERPRDSVPMTSAAIRRPFSRTRVLSATLALSTCTALACSSDSNQMISGPSGGGSGAGGGTVAAGSGGSLGGVGGSGGGATE